MSFDIDLVGAITALAILIGAFVNMKTASSKTISEITEAVDKLIGHLNDELDRCRKEKATTNAGILVMVEGVRVLIKQLVLVGIDPGFTVPAEYRNLQS